MSGNTENDRIRELSELRGELDRIDGELLELFAKRLDTAREIGAYKRLHSLPVTDGKREEEKLASVKETVSPGLAPHAGRFMRFLMEEAKTAQREAYNLYLIGMPDCGKTRIGKKLAKNTGMPVADTDKLIMNRMNMSIDDIFAAYSEEGFRSMETMMLVQLIKKGGAIVATGGGLPLWGDNPRLIKNSGVTVFLDRKLENLFGQNTHNRPLLAQNAHTEAEVNENIKRLYYERRPKYLAMADITVDPDEPGSAERIAELFKQKLEER